MGARFGPRAIREASTHFSFGHGGAYDHEDDTVYLPLDKVRIVDVGDADMVHTDTGASHANAEKAARKIVQSGALRSAIWCALFYRQGTATIPSALRL